MLIIFDILRNINSIIIISLLNSKTHHLHRRNWDGGTFHRIWEGRAELSDLKFSGSVSLNVFREKGDQPPAAPWASPILPEGLGHVAAARKRSHQWCVPLPQTILKQLEE